MSTNRRVVITGLGAVTSIGLGKDEFWNNLLKGVSGISRVSSVDTTLHFTHFGGEVKLFKAEDFFSRQWLKSHGRASQLAYIATRFAIKDANLSADDISTSRVATCIGTTMGSVHAIEEIDENLLGKVDIPTDLISQLPTHSTPSMIAREFNLAGPTFMFSTACSAGNYAIGYGYDLIRLNRADSSVVGASDPFSRSAFTGFNQLSAVAPEKCQPFDKNRKGMMVAEGSGILILESLENALKRKASIYAEILGYGLSCDAQHMTQPSIEGVSQCMIRAMLEANIKDEDVDYISAHGTGTRANDKIECAAIQSVFGPRCQKIPVSSIKSMLGHTMGAASALEAVACALSVKNDVIPPTINFETPDPECDIDCVPNQARAHKVDVALNNSYAFGGNNACLVLKKYIY